MKRRWIGCVLVSLSCQDKGDEPMGEVTWYKDIQPIVGENCKPVTMLRIRWVGLTP